MVAEATGSAVFAIRWLKKPATPAAAPTGPSAIGTHIILLPKLALSCSKKISAAVTSAPAAVSADRLRSKRPVSMLRTIRSRRCSVMSPPWARRQVPHRTTRGGLVKPGRRGRRDLCGSAGRQLAQGYLDVPLIAVAADGQGDLVARARRRQGLGQRGGVRGLLGADADDHVAGLQPSLVGRAAA